MVEISAACKELLNLANVVGVGIGYKVTDGEIVRDDEGNPIECVVVSVRAKVPAGELPPGDLVPAVVDHAPTDVVATGPITVVTDSPVETAAIDPKLRRRPIVPGLSIGLNPGVTAGTLGLIVERVGSSDRFILSNWHVMAANNTPVENRDIVAITQPGNTDGGRPPDDVVADLVELIPIDSGGGSPIPSPDPPSNCPVASAVVWFPNLLARLIGSDTRLAPIVASTGGRVLADGENLVDAALARIDVPYDRATPEIGTVTETGTPTLGMRVQKFGRTTGHTIGTISQVGATFRVQGYPGGTATFSDQVAITADDGPFLQGGDSGSGLVSLDGKAVGLCFAGSTTIGIANTWPNVEAALDVKPAAS
jgi:hypothetical protein